MEDNKLDIVKSKIDTALGNFKKDSRRSYIALTITLIAGIIFFLSSNMIFNKTSTDISTEIDKELIYENTKVSLESREYNPTSGFIKFNVVIDDNNLDRTNEVKFELRSKNNPGELIPLEVVKVTERNYIVYTTYKKKWDYLSLATILVNMNDSEDIIGPFKMYSNIVDFGKDNGLIAKTEEEYYVEIIDNEIASLSKNIELLDRKIEENLNSIENIKEKNASLEEEKKYQIESEQAETQGLISNNNSTIAIKEKDNLDLKNQINTNYEKINKLEIKKSDFLTGSDNE